MRNKTSYMWALIGRILPQSVYLVTTFILARVLTPEDFGQIGILIIFTSIAQILLDSGLGGSLIKEKEITQLDCSTIFVFNLVVSIIAYCSIFTISPLIEKYYQIAGLSNVCRVLSLVFVINAFGQIPQTLLFRELRFKHLTIASTCSVIIGSIIAILCAYYFEIGVYSLVTYQIVQASCFVFFNFYNSKFCISLKFSQFSFKRLFSFGVYTTITNIIDSAYENIIVSLFGKYIGINQAGYLSQAKKIETASCNALVATINSVSFPILTRLKETPNSFIMEANSLFKTVSLLILPPILSIALFSNEIITILFGNNWIEAAPYLRILMWVGSIYILESIIRNYIKALCEVDKLLFTTIIKRFLGLIIVIIFIFINPENLLYGYLIGAILGLIANLICYTHIQHIGIMKYSMILFQSLWQIIVLYSIGILCYNFIPNRILCIFTWLFILCVYYCYLIRLSGINIFKLTLRK